MTTKDSNHGKLILSNLSDPASLIPKDCPRQVVSLQSVFNVPSVPELTSDTHSGGSSQTWSNRILPLLGDPMWSSATPFLELCDQIRRVRSESETCSTSFSMPKVPHSLACEENGKAAATDFGASTAEQKKVFFSVLATLGPIRPSSVSTPLRLGKCGHAAGDTTGSIGTDAEIVRETHATHIYNCLGEPTYISTAVPDEISNFPLEELSGIYRWQKNMEDQLDNVIKQRRLELEGALWSLFRSCGKYGPYMLALSCKRMNSHPVIMDHRTQMLYFRREHASLHAANIAAWGPNR